MQAFELVPEYKVLASPVRKWFKIIGALPFVEPSTVDDVWPDIVNSVPSEIHEFISYFERTRLSTVDDVWPDIVNSVPSKIHEFISYFERTWLGSPSTVPLFDRFLWTQFDSVLAGLPRSKNIVESWHNGFQSLVGTSNPTLWTFLTAMKQEENQTFAKRVKMRMNEQPEPKKRKWRLYDERLTCIVSDFENYDPMDYLHCIGEMLFTA